MENLRKPSPLGRLLAALEEENIRFMLIGMSAAIVQGVLGTTVDVDFWLDLPSGPYMRVQNIARRTGGNDGRQHRDRIKHNQWTNEQASTEAREYGMSRWEYGMKNFVTEFAKCHMSQ